MSLRAIVLCIALAPFALLRAAESWTIYVANDNCPDYTWGLSEEQTRQAFADVLRGHLDEMNRTDREPSENRDRYNAAVLQEAICFCERYPERKDELVRRINEGRVYVSPYLCNTLWGLQSAEGTLRAFYPARRVEREWGIALDAAHHIEQPSLPWGTATLLAGCGFRSLTVPFYGYDSTWSALRNPPLFWLEGPDGSRIRVWLDRWASSKASYTQGAAILRQPNSIRSAWLEHYAGLGDAYPLRAILASGTHGDIAPHSGNQAREFAEAIRGYNARPDKAATLVNATFPQFWQAVDRALAKKPFLPIVRGCFGHSWDVWPVSLAAYAAHMRDGERKLLAAEALLAVTAPDSPARVKTQADRERAEWCWAMLADHAWNGTDDQNKRHNAELLRRWAEELNRISEDCARQGWLAAGVQSSDREVAVFNSLSFPRTALVRCAGLAAASPMDGDLRLPVQAVEEDGARVAYCVVPAVPAFGFRQLRLTADGAQAAAEQRLRATATTLESPFYRLAVDPQTGGIASLIHKPSGRDIVVHDGSRSLCQTVYCQGREQTLAGIVSEVVAQGPVLARLRVHGSLPGLDVTTLVTVYAELDRVDFAVHVQKSPGNREERLCHMFPIMRPGATLRVASAGAVVRPRLQPDGDLLPGADTRRFAVQEFVDAADADLSVTVVPLDAFALRLDLGVPAFEALGNDQNYREVLHDQHGVKQFRFRYSLRAQAGGFRLPGAATFSRDAACPPLVTLGRLPDQGPEPAPTVRIDPARAVATCLKPAEAAPHSSLLRLWETAGRAEPICVHVSGFTKAVETDLLERDRQPLELADGQITVPIKPHGYAAVRLTR